ncbi:plasmalemma vesicle associated protein a isoform 2-T2 [Clarias gariepinus]
MYKGNYKGGYSDSKLSLIIVSLVLFLVYGQPEQTAEEKRVLELEQSFNKLRMEKAALQEKEKNLTKELNITMTAKKAVEKDMNTLRELAKNSTLSITYLQTRWRFCETEKRSVLPPVCPQNPYTDTRGCMFALQKSDEMLKLVNANFTEQMATMRMNLENANKEKLQYHLQAIELRRSKAFLEERIQKYEKSCKEDFVKSLQGIPNVTREFLKKVDDLFTKHESFQLTCEKQSTKLEDIRANCSSLSREVENKLQLYLDKVGSQVSSILGANAKYETENKRLTVDAAWCKGNLSATVEQNQQALKQGQLKYDQETEKLLLQVRQLTESGKLKEKLLSVKEIDIKILTENIKAINASLILCKATQKPLGPLPPVRSFPWSGSLGPQIPGLSSTGHGTTGLGNGASNGINVLGRTGSGLSTGLNSAGSSSTSLVKPLGTGSIVTDQQVSAQITQHLRELQRFTK